MPRSGSKLRAIVLASGPLVALIGAALLAVADYSSAQLAVVRPASQSGTVVVTAPAEAPAKTLTWLLNTPAPRVIPFDRSNPVAVSDKFASRAKSADQRAALRAFEGAPPVIPHPIGGLNIQTCRACHAEGLKAGDKTARMASHAYLINCTQCHVEVSSPMHGDDQAPSNSFVGMRSGGYGGTRAYTGAPPAMPHTLFMRTNCVSCHGEFGYDGWRPDHLARTNCIQCHAPAAEFDQLSPAFAQPDVPDGGHASLNDNSGTR